MNRLHQYGALEGSSGSMINRRIIHSNLMVNLFKVAAFKLSIQALFVAC